MAKLHKKAETTRIPNDILATLEACDLPYEVVAGRKHLHIKLMGRIVGILPRRLSHHLYARANKNVIAQIKRAAAYLKDDPTWVGRS